MKNSKMNLVERTLAPTPKWFKILRTVGIALASVGGIIIASPIAFMMMNKKADKSVE